MGYLSLIHCKSHLNTLPTELTQSIACNLQWKGTKVRQFIQKGTDFDCLDQIQKFKIFLKAN